MKSLMTIQYLVRANFISILTRKRVGTVVCAIALMAGSASVAYGQSELVIASHGVSHYQIVVPEHAHDTIVDRWLMATAKLMQAAFQKSGFIIPVVQESAEDPNKPTIYLGATKFARKHHIQVETDDWTYVWKVVEKNLVIVGSDRESPGSRLALLGSVKGALDFLKEFVRVHFLFLNFQDMSNPEVYRKEEGSVPLDTRNIDFEPVQQIAVPANLNLRKTPPVRSRPAGGGGGIENFYTIANNYFPQMSATHTEPVKVTAYEVVSFEKYGKSHPEYSALLPNGKRASTWKLENPSAYLRAYPRYPEAVPPDITNPDVLNLIVSATEKEIKQGAQSILLSPMDSYYLCLSNDARSNAFFGIGAKTDEEIHARGESGKLWKFFFLIAKHIHQKYPKVKIYIWDYQDTPLGSKYIKSLQSFPNNVIPLLHMGSLSDFDKLSGVKFPSGVAAVEETFTGFNLDGGYAPERTPAYASRMAKAMMKYGIQWTSRDGSLGYVRGMQAPAYYVYGRMLDDTSSNYEHLLKEFYTAAFHKVAPQMSKFFDLLHDQMAIYSDWIGMYQPAWKDVRHNYRNNNKWYHQIIYTVEYIKEADALLTSAEKNEKNIDVKARLHLIRIDFDYVTNLSKVLYLQDAWMIHPSSQNLNVLLDAIDTWNDQIKHNAGKPLPGWPQMYPFKGNEYEQVRRVRMPGTGYQNGKWKETSLNWNTAEIRKAIQNGNWDTAKMQKAVQDGLEMSKAIPRKFYNE